MRSVRVPAMVLVLLVALWAAGGPADVAANNGTNREVEHIVLEDDCDPGDAAWGVNGCLRKKGTVTRAEFNQFSLFQPPAFPAPPLANAVIGHPSWRIDPSYVVIDEGARVKVMNDGGRGHSFTEVAEYGGGVVPPLNFGLTQAAACIDAASPPVTILPGDRSVVSELGVGNHKFQCCFHPWMRALVKVQ
jgi:hypothetical protein